MQVAHDHDDQGLEEEPVGVHAWSAGAAFFGRLGGRQAVHEFDEGDKQTVLAYHRGYLHLCRFGVVTTMMWRWPRRVKPKRGLSIYDHPSPIPRTSVNKGKKGPRRSRPRSFAPRAPAVAFSRLGPGLADRRS